MRFVRYAAAAIITVILLLVSRSLTVTQPVEMDVTAGGIQVEHLTVPKIIDGDPDYVPVTIRNPENIPLSVVFRYGYYKGNIPDFSHLDSIPMGPHEDNPQVYIAKMPPRDVGTVTFYFLEIRNLETGEVITTVPADKAKPAKLKFMGHVPDYILLPHIFLMFVAVYFAALGFFDAVRIVFGAPAVKSMGWNFLLALLSVFIGGYPLGWAMNYYAFGTMWEGIPFGWDFTDNKTQIVLFYLVFLVLSMPGAFRKDNIDANNFSRRVLGWLGILGFALVVSIYIIPHSIQFSIPITALFAYGLTALIVGLYLLGLIRKGKWSAPN